MSSIVAQLRSCVAIQPCPSHRAQQRHTRCRDLSTAREMVFNGATTRSLNKIHHRRATFVGHGCRRARLRSRRSCATARRSSSTARPRRITSGIPRRPTATSPGWAFTAVYFTDNGTNGNFVQNNIIGLNPSGTNRLRNQRMGVDINFGASQNLIGGTGPGRAQRHLRQRRRRRGGLAHHGDGRQPDHRELHRHGRHGQSGAELHPQQRAGRARRGRRTEHADQRQRIGDNLFGGVVVEGTQTAGTRSSRTSSASPRTALRCPTTSPASS